MPDSPWLVVLLCLQLSLLPLERSLFLEGVDNRLPRNIPPSLLPGRAKAEDQVQQQTRSHPRPEWRTSLCLLHLTELRLCSALPPQVLVNTERVFSTLPFLCNFASAQRSHCWFQVLNCCWPWPQPPPSWAGSVTASQEKHHEWLTQIRVCKVKFRIQMKPVCI